jgi:MoaA/NifB/PqqE/SkfB family radical SAM enzyme
VRRPARSRKHPDPQRIPVTVDGFVRLPEFLRERARARGPESERGLLAAGALPEFQPDPLPRADAALLDWLRVLRAAAAAAKLDVEIEGPDAELLALLRTVARAADPLNRGILLRLLGAITGGVFRGPQTFHLDVANACNVNCAYCWFHSPLSKERVDAADFDADWRREMVDWEVFTGIVDDLHALGTREDLLLSGKGEPLLHPRCLDMVAYAKARGLGLSLFSNGVLVRDPVRQALVRAGCDLLYVSLSSASHAAYEALHPGHPGTELDEVLDNVRALQALKQRAGATLPRVMMVDVICGANAAEVLGFYDQAAALGAEHVRFQLIHVQPYNRSLKLDAEQVVSVREQLAQARRREAAGGPRIVDNIEYQLETLDLPSGRWGHARTPDEGCFVGWTFSRSWTNGDVSFCCSPKVVDNVSRRSFAEIWRGPAYAAYRNAAKDLARNGAMRFENGATLLGEHCAGCPNYEGIGKLAADLRRYGLERFVRGADGDRLRGGGGPS